MDPNWTHALAVDETGRAHIAFDTVGQPQIKLASRAPDGWIVEDVSREFAWDIQFEFESGELLVMVLATPEQYSGAGGELLALTRSNTGWRRQEIALGADARTLDSPIAIGGEGAAISITTDEWNTGSNAVAASSEREKSSPFAPRALLRTVNPCSGRARPGTRFDRWQNKFPARGSVA